MRWAREVDLEWWLASSGRFLRGKKGETVVGWSKRRREVSLVGSLREHNGRDFTQGQVGTA